MADTFQSQAGRVALVTGANTGIGRVTALALARQGMQVFLACRSKDRTVLVLEEIRSMSTAPPPEWLPLDLGDFDSVAACARSFLARGQPLHLLVNNAGLAGQRGTTRSGFEMAFGVNHMGHFLLTRLLLDRLKRSAPSRIVTVASRAHTRVNAIDWQAVRGRTTSLSGAREYCVSKLANVLFSAELAGRLRDSGVSTYALHPGVIDSDIWRALPWPLRALNRLRLISTEEGAQTTLYCSLSPIAANQTGLYYSRCQPIPPSLAGQDAGLGAELWLRSESWVGAR